MDYAVFGLNVGLNHGHAVDEDSAQHHRHGQSKATQGLQLHAVGQHGAGEAAWHNVVANGMAGRLRVVGNSVVGAVGQTVKAIVAHRKQCVRAGLGQHVKLVGSKSPVYKAAKVHIAQQIGL